MASLRENQSVVSIIECRWEGPSRGEIQPTKALLVDDGVDGDRSLLGLTVTNDQLSLAASEIKESTASKPVGMGSWTDLRGMMPRALTSARDLNSDTWHPCHRWLHQVRQRRDQGVQGRHERPHNRTS